MTIIKEGRIILPAQGNHGEDLSSLHAQLQADLIHLFGGCSLLAGLGSWRDPAGTIRTEPVIHFLVAADSLPSNNYKLIELARRYGTLARQQAVYLANFSGEVSFIEPLQIAATAQAQAV